ncbi:MAG: glycosyltransferase family 2 protein [Pseudomonadota bacterium]
MANQAETFLAVTTMKNEAPFMLEWVAHNQAIGYDSFLIFTNDCDDGTDDIARRLDELGIASHVNNNDRPLGRRTERPVSPQRYALRVAKRHERFEDADWVICCDCDEFLNLRTGATLPDLVKASGPADAISVCWKLFGNGFRRHYEDVPVMEQFFRAAPEDSFTNFRGAGIKTLFRNNGAFHRMGVHRPKVIPEQAPDPDKPYAHVTWRDAGGQTHDAETITWRSWSGFSHGFARMHHYAIRSCDSFLVKRDRGRTNHVLLDQGRDYFDAMNTNQTRDDTMMQRVPGMLEARAKLLSDPVLKELHEHGVAWHRAKIEDIKSRADWEEFIDMVYSHPGVATRTKKQRLAEAEAAKR